MAVKAILKKKRSIINSTDHNVTKNCEFASITVTLFPKYTGNEHLAFSVLCCDFSECLCYSVVKENKMKSVNTGN